MRTKNIEIDLDTGIELMVAYRLNGRRHRDEGPAVVKRDAESGRIWWEEYRWHGRFHRDPTAGPAAIGYDTSADAAMSWDYWWRGKRHRLDGPAATCHFGALADLHIVEEYYVHGKEHRDPAEGPAYIKRFPSETFAREVRYYANGQLHREHGPATIFRNEKGLITLQEYYLRDMLHREPDEGPALLARDKATGELTRCEYHLHGARAAPPRKPGRVRFFGETRTYPVPA